MSIDPSTIVRDPSIAAAVRGLSIEQAELRIARHVERKHLEDRISRYWPYPKQAKFHELGKTKRQRLLRAGNQQGKTLCVGAEVSFHLTGKYPKYWKGRVFDRPTTVWASSDTGETTRDNPQRVLLGPVGERGVGMVQGELLGEYAWANGVSDLLDYIKVKNAFGGWSLLRFKYYAQGRAKWQGPPVDVVWYDEEPEEDIYDEGLARTIATGGIAMISATPLRGMSNVMKRFLLSPEADMGQVQMDITDAEHIPEDKRAAIVASFKPHEREARSSGVPVLGSGRVFPVTEESIKVEPMKIPAHWPRLAGLDFGWDHPAAVAWLAWDRDTDTVYVYDCYREREVTPAVQSLSINARGKWIPVAWPHDGHQHDKGSGIQLAKQYRDLGVAMRQEYAHFEETEQEGEARVNLISVEAGINLMLEKMQNSTFKVFSHLNDWWEEFRLYHRQEGKLVKEGEDLMSATRVAMMDLRFAKVEPKKAERHRPPANWRC